MNTRLLATLLALCAADALARSPKDRPDRNRPAPVSVSAANYAETPREELLRAEVDKGAVNPTTPRLEKLARPQRYVFLPGELYASDLDFAEICRRLAAALEKKGYLNAVDDQGRVIDPKNVDLILRVHAGEREWRQPTVRTSSLMWRDGLVERPRGRTLTTLGGDVLWQQRAGGNDDALGAAARNENAPGFGYGSAPATPPGASPLSSGSAHALSAANSAAAEYDATREFHLLVVDGFSYAELMEKGRRAKRLWTTFIAAPRQRNEKFSDVLATMLRIATPYFGETTSGLQMFNDARAEVHVGDLQVIETDVKTLPRSR